MYYSIFQWKTVIYRRLTAFFFISIFLIAIPVRTFAEILDKTVNEYHQKANEEQAKGNLEQALAYYSKALSLGLKDPKVYNDVGILYEQLGAGNRARDYYREAIQFNPQYLPAYTNLAYSYLEEGDTQTARVYFRKRLEKAPAKDPWRDKIEEELAKIDPDYQNHKKEQIAKEAARLKAELVVKAREEFNLQIVRAEKHYQQGQAYYTEGKFKEATLEFNRALALTPDNPKMLRARKEAVFRSRVDDIRKRTNSAIEKLDDKDVDSAKKQFEDILTHFPSE